MQDQQATTATNEFETYFSKPGVHSHFSLESNHDDGLETFNNNPHDYIQEDIGVPEVSPSPTSSPSSMSPSPSPSPMSPPFSRSATPSDQEGSYPSSSPASFSMIPLATTAPLSTTQQRPLNPKKKPQPTTLPHLPFAHGPLMSPSPQSSVQPQPQIRQIVVTPPPPPQQQSTQKRSNEAATPATPEQDDEEQKRLTKRQKNNEAAHKCRQKKKQADEENLERNKYLEVENAALKKDLERFQTELKCLKEVIVALSQKNN